MIWEQCVSTVPQYVLVTALVRVVLTARKYVILIVAERAKVDVKLVVHIAVLVAVVHHIAWVTVLWVVHHHVIQLATESVKMVVANRAMTVEEHVPHRVEKCVRLQYQETIFHLDVERVMRRAQPQIHLMRE